MRKAVYVQALLFLVLWAMGLSAQPLNQQGQRVREIVFDHAKVNEDRSFKIFAAPGELIRVRIINTCPSDFDINVRKIVQALPPPADIIVNCQLAEAEPVDILHEEKYGGYNVEMRLKAGVALPQVLFDGKSVTLQPVDIIISVESKVWDYEMSGAFTTSGLNDPKFGLKMQKDPQDSDPNATEKPFVVHDRDAEDEARLGVAAFIHLFQPIRPAFAATFGLGINDNNKTTYFTGLTYRFGESGAFTAGYNWGSVSRLPAGTDVDRPVAPDLLSKLESQIKGSWFFALSYKFLNPAGRLSKPFQDVPAASGGTATGGSSPSPAPATPAPATPAPAPPAPIPPAPATPPPANPAPLPGGVTPGLPATPRLRTPTSTCTSVTLTWEPVAAPRTYRVFRSTEGCSTGMREIANDVAQETFVDQPLLPGRQFHYAVRSDNGLQSNLSNCEAVATPACPNNQ